MKSSTYRFLRITCIGAFLCLVALSPQYAQQSDSLSPKQLDRYQQLRDSLQLVSEQTEAEDLLWKMVDFFTYDYENLDSAWHYTQKNYELSQRHTNYQLMGQSKITLSYIAYLQEDYTRAKEEVSAAIHYLRQANDSTLLFQSMINQGVIYYKLGVLDQALRTNLKTARYYEDIEDTESLILVLNNLGLIYQGLGNLDKAQTYYQRVLTLSEELDDPTAGVNSLQNLANVHAERGEYQTAIDYYRRIIDITAPRNLLRDLTKAYNGIGYTYYYLKDYQAAIEFAEKSMAVDPQEKYTEDDVNNLHTIGMSYLELNEFDKAEEYLKRAHDIATAQNFIAELIPFEEGLYQLYDRMNDHQRALAYYKDYIAAKDRIYGDIISANVNEIETEFLAKEKEQALQKMERQMLEEEQRFQRRMNYIGASLAAVSLLFVIFYQQQRVVLARNKQQLTTNKYESLRAQMNPHFIFNTINGVQNQILKSDKLEAYNYLNRFAETIRLMLNNSGHSFVSLREEVELIEHYLALESVRFPGKFQYEFIIDDELVERNPLIPTMILQPIVENTVIHGLSNKEGEGRLLINISLQEKSLLCTVEDDGIGRTAAMKLKRNRGKNHLSMASENTKERINLLKKFGYKQSQLFIEDLYDAQGNAAGTRVQFVVPFKG